MRVEVNATNIDEIARAVRDLDAAKARVERDAKLVADETRKRLVGELLPVLDNLDRTIAAGDRDGSAEALVEGARRVRDQLEGVLRGYGVERVDALSQRFDPALHDAIGLLDVRDRAFHDVVIDQVEPCYRYGETLLRPAKVIVGRCADS
jgi:molecular chaperone GrpE